MLAAKLEITENIMIALADKEAKNLLAYIIREQCHQDLIPMANEPYTHFKKWAAHMLPQW
jgi:hypothetical protein